MDRNHTPVTLLTIEDDRLVRQAMASYLKGFGYQILQAADGAEGIEIFRKSQPDLVLTDLRMPKVDGMDVLAVIREEAPDTPVIIVSGMGTRDDVIKALKLGARDYVTKPISDMALLEYAVDQALERAQLVKENRRYQTSLEKKIKLKTAELHQAQKLEAIGTLAGGIAHDFNNILAAIMGFTELVMMKVDVNSDVGQDLLQIKKASDRARNLVLQILTFSRKAVTERHPVQVSLIIKEALKLLRATLPTTVEIIQNIVAQQETILADSTEIHQIITNLCTNAFHALTDEKGEIVVELTVHAVTADELKDNPVLNNKEYLQLRVSDNGCGIDIATVNNIFDPFFTTKEKGRGTGLGLSVVHGIVSDCSGIIRVDTEPGKGTTFVLLFPLVQPVVHIEHEAIISPPGGKERILFVDDEEELRTLAKKMLIFLGYSVFCCSSGQDALSKISEEKIGFDLIITDQSMPKMPGTELARKVWIVCPGLPVLLCTGYSSMVDGKKALSMGINGFLQKPFTINILAREIRRILDQ